MESVEPSTGNADAPDRLHRRYRWAVLAVFAVAAGVTQMLWLNFAPLLSMVQTRYGVSELVASTLVLVFPLVYVFLSLPAGALIDSRGYRVGVGFGMVLTAAFAALRIWDTYFAVLMVAQVGIAVAQPFVMNGISKLIADWFDETEGATANGIGTGGMFLGMAIGMATTPALEEAVGLRWTMVVFFAIAVAAAAAFIAVARANTPGAAPAVVEQSPTAAFGALLKDRQLLLCFTAVFFGMGTFNGITTWLEEILKPQGISATTAGLVGAVLIVGGIVGAVVIPLLSDKVKKRRPFLIVCSLVSAGCTWLLCTSGQVGALMAYAGLLGFFFMPAFALLLDASAIFAGVHRAGAATSLLMLCGNGGAVLVIVAIPLLKESAGSYALPVLLMVGAMVVAAAVAAVMREPLAPANPLSPGSGRGPG